jgi:serine protease Do
MKEHKQGIIITKVEENSQADRAHLKKGDIILKVDEEDIQNTTHFRYELYKHEIGDTIHFVVERNGSKKSISLKLEENDDFSHKFFSGPSNK